MSYLDYGVNNTFSSAIGWARAFAKIVETRNITQGWTSGPMSLRAVTF